MSEQSLEWQMERVKDTIKTVSRFAAERSCMFHLCLTCVNHSAPSLSLTQPLLQKSSRPLPRSTLVESPGKAGGLPNNNYKGRGKPRGIIPKRLSVRSDWSGLTNKHYNSERCQKFRFPRNTCSTRRAMVPTGSGPRQSTLSGFSVFASQVICRLAS